MTSTNLMLLTLQSQHFVPSFSEDTCTEMDIAYS